MLDSDQKPLELLPVPSIVSLQKSLTTAEALRSALSAQVEANNREIKLLEHEEQLLEMVGALIRRLIDAEVTDGVQAVERLQTEGLQEIFHDQKLSVRAEVGESRGKVSVSLRTVQHRSDGTEVEGSPDTAFGGSVMTMQSILMRVTVLFRRNLRPLLLLDETLAAVANNYVDRAANFLSALSERLGLDILLITHDEALVGAAHNAYQIRYIDDQAKFRKMSRKRK
jgi:ABC-type microcin C transport system duplicated ATPase subunit YejF